MWRLEGQKVDFPVFVPGHELIKIAMESHRKTGSNFFVHLSLALPLGNCCLPSEHMEDCLQVSNQNLLSMSSLEENMLSFSVYFMWFMQGQELIHNIIFAWKKVKCFVFKVIQSLEYFPLYYQLLLYISKNQKMW